MEPVQTNQERAREMLVMYRQGFTLQEMGKKFHVTRERVRQIIESKWKEEIEANVSLGYSVDVESYLVSQRKVHSMERERREHAELLAKKFEFSKMINKYTSARAFCKDYNVTMDATRKMFPDIYKRLILMEQERAKRWSKNYTKCRLCETTVKPHFQEGFCTGCFRDAKVFGGNREKAMKNAGHRCQSCKVLRTEYIQNKKRDLSVLHVGDKLDHKLSNLRVLCYACMVAQVKPQKSRRYALDPNQLSLKRTG